MPVECVCQNSLCNNVFYVSPAQYARRRGLYCCAPCVQQGHKQKHILVGNKPRPLAERFWEKVQVCSHGRECPYCCWDWKGSKLPSGHGLFARKIDNEWHHCPSQRTAWELLNDQPMPAYLHGCHYCNNGWCNNGMHVYAGTQKQNMEDARKNGAYGERHARGEQNGKARLTAEQIPTIWRLRADGSIMADIANHLHVSLGTIAAVLHYRTWGHISRLLTSGST